MLIIKKVIGGHREDYNFSMVYILQRNVKND